MPAKEAQRILAAEHFRSGAEGDPDAFLHPPTHEHSRVKPAGWRKCEGCNPPVHGDPVLVAKGRG